MPFQINFGPSGPVPTPPATLRAKLIALVTSFRPGITMTLPASLIEDVSSTSVGALAIIDQTFVDLINSLSARTANPFILNQLGQQFGIQLGTQSNTSVFVIFSGDAGFVLGKGFVVSDGLYQYALVDGGIIGQDGKSAPLFALATQPGIWSVPSGTVTEIITDVPSPYSVTVVNPQPGIPGSDTQSIESYRAEVLEASYVGAQGYFSLLKTLLGKVDGVQQRLINAISQPGGGWEIIVGGGDPFEVAYAIYSATQDISTLVGSTIRITGITNANPGVVTTDITHGYTVGQAITISGVDPSDYDGSFNVLAVPTSNSFSLGNAFAQNNITALSWSGGNVTVTTQNPHGVTVGSSIVLSGNTPTGYNGTFTAIAGTTGSTIVYASSNPGSATGFGILQAGIAKFNTTSLTPWAAGGVVSPNFRNITPTIIDYPNSYVIPFAVPAQQTVTMTITWDTTSPDFVSEAAVAQVIAPAIADYVNTIQQGQPINELSMNAVFQKAVSGILDTSLISNIAYAVSIDGVGVSPVGGTSLVYGDPQSFLFAVSTGINVVQA